MTGIKTVGVVKMAGNLGNAEVVSVVSHRTAIWNVISG